MISFGEQNTRIKFERLAYPALPTATSKSSILSMAELLLLRTAKPDEHPRYATAHWYRLLLECRKTRVVQWRVAGKTFRIMK